MMLKVIILILAVEAALQFVVRLFRKEFQWLITQKDETPHLDEEGLRKFFKHGYDRDLGWVRKPNTNGIERGAKRTVSYRIDPLGARENPLIAGKDPVIAAFGDSYVFCRQVNDDETWPFYLTNKINAGVLNFGVGNYGVDQAVLRYEKTALPDSVRVVIMGFVPETICRIQSCWKHYFEFGNTFAFKPRFKLEDDALRYLPNVMQKEEDFLQLEEKLTAIRENDGFYKRKFRSMQFRFPYILSYLRNFRRNTALLYHLINRWAARKFGRSTSKIENAPFEVIMESNINEAHKMYSDTNACKLLKAVLLKFKDDAIKKGHTPIILVMPQLMDLTFSQGKQAPYAEFFRELNNDVPTLDLTEYVLTKPFESIYVEDSFGGHFSKEGNALIAEHIGLKINKMYEHKNS